MKKTNWETIIQTFVLVLAAILLGYGLISGKVNKFVHPRFNIGLWISIVVLLFFAVSILFDRKKGRHNINIKQYIVYLIPLILAIAFPPIAAGNTEMVLADSKTSSNAEINYSQSESDGDIEQNNNKLENSQDKQNLSSAEEDDNQKSYNNTQYSNVDEYLQDTQDTQDTQENQDTQDNQESKEENKKTDTSDVYHTNEVNGSYVIDDDVFADWFMDLYDHLDDFVGERYQFLAQVYSMDDLKENQFLAGRNFMVCCAADLVGYGLICNSDMRSELKENEWITVTATISKCEYDGSEVPMLKDAVITKAKAPKVEYIYYNNY